MIMTGNDFALAQMAAQLAMAWHKGTPESAFRDAEVRKLRALSAKLDKLLDDNRALVETSDGECEFEVRDYYDLTPTS